MMRAIATVSYSQSPSSFIPRSLGTLTTCDLDFICDQSGLLFPGAPFLRANNQREKLTNAKNQNGFTLGGAHTCNTHREQL